MPLYGVDRQALLPRSQVLDGLDGAFDEDRAGWAPSGSTLDPRERVPSLYSLHHARLRLAAVRYVLSFRPLPEELVTARGEAALPEVLEPLQLYELKDPLPRAFEVGRYEVERDPERLAARLESPGHDPRALVLLSEEPARRHGALRGESGRSRRGGEPPARESTRAAAAGRAAVRASWS